jgi:hypothetical protein
MLRLILGFIITEWGNSIYFLNCNLMHEFDESVHYLDLSISRQEHKYLHSRWRKLIL